jgi:hypothetical protein
MLLGSGPETAALQQHQMCRLFAFWKMIVEHFLVWQWRPLGFRELSRRTWLYVRSGDVARRNDIPAVEPFGKLTTTYIVESDM